MTKFCTKCGKKLEEGKTCECKKTVDKAKEVKTVPAEKKEVEKVVKTTAEVKSVANDLGKKLLEIVSKIINKPVTTTKKFAKGTNVGLGFILMGSAVLFMAVLFAFVAGEFLSLFGLFGGMGSYSSMGFGIDTFKIFIYGVLIGGLYFTAIVFSLYLVLAKMLKININLKKTFMLVAIPSTILAYTFAVAIIGVLVAFEIAFLALSLGTLYFTITLYSSINELEEVSSDKIAMFFVIMFGMVYTGLYIISRVVL